MMAFSFMAFHSFCISRITLYGNLKVEHRKGILLIEIFFQMSIKYNERSNNMSSPHIAIDLAK